MTHFTDEEAVAFFEKLYPTFKSWTEANKLKRGHCLLERLIEGGVKVEVPTPRYKVIRSAVYKDSFFVRTVDGQMLAQFWGPDAEKRANDDAEKLNKTLHSTT